MKLTLVGKMTSNPAKVAEGEAKASGQPVHGSGAHGSTGAHDDYGNHGARPTGNNYTSDTGRTDTYGTTGSGSTGNDYRHNTTGAGPTGAHSTDSSGGLLDKITPGHNAHGFGGNTESISPTGNTYGNHGTGYTGNNHSTGHTGNNYAAGNTHATHPTGTTGSFPTTHTTPHQSSGSLLDRITPGHNAHGFGGNTTTGLSSHNPNAGLADQYRDRGIIPNNSHNSPSRGYTSTPYSNTGAAYNTGYTDNNSYSTGYTDNNTHGTHGTSGNDNNQHYNSQHHDNQHHNNQHHGHSAAPIIPGHGNAPAGY